MTDLTDDIVCVTLYTQKQSHRETQPWNNRELLANIAANAEPAYVTLENIRPVSPVPGLIDID